MRKGRRARSQFGLRAVPKEQVAALEQRSTELAQHNLTLKAELTPKDELALGQTVPLGSLVSGLIAANQTEFNEASTEQIQKTGSAEQLKAPALEKDEVKEVDKAAELAPNSATNSEIDAAEVTNEAQETRTEESKLDESKIEETRADASTTNEVRPVAANHINAQLEVTDPNEAPKPLVRPKKTAARWRKLRENLLQGAEALAAKQALEESNKQQAATEPVSRLAAALDETKAQATPLKASDFNIPKTDQARYALALELKLLPASRPKRLLRYKRQRFSAADLRFGIKEMLQLSRNYVQAEIKERQLIRNRNYAALSDQQLQAALLIKYKAEKDLKPASKEAEMPILEASLRQKAREKERAQAKYQKVVALFKAEQVTAPKKVIWKQKFANFLSGLRTARLVLTIFVLIVGIALSLVALLPQFYLQDVEVRGNEHLSAKDIEQILNVKKGQHLLALVNGNLLDCLQGRNKKLELKLKDNYPILAAVNCHISLPGKLVINVRETTEIAYLKIPGGYADIDAEGRVLSLNMGEPSDYVPLIKGLDVSKIVVNQHFKEINSRSFNNAIMLMDGLMRSDADSSDNLQLAAALKSINLMPDFSLWLEFNFGGNEKNNLTVHLNADVNGYADQIYWLRNTKQIGALDGLGPGYVDLTGKQKVFVSLESSAASDEELNDMGNHKIKAQAWDESEWSWKDIVTKSFTKRVSD